MPTNLDCPKATPYNSKFYEVHADGSLRSACVIVPLILELVRPESVVDIGCGVGTWLRTFTEHGVSRVLGVDGAYVQRDWMQIDPAHFRTMDLANPQPLAEKFDLAVCLEVGEHLPGRSSRRLVRLLTEAAPVVLFSAALPGQGGTNHINERWPSFWRSLFLERGFERLDPIRRQVWFDERVEWWYRQNVYVYASPDAIASSEELRSHLRQAQEPLELVHRDLVERDNSFRSACRLLVRSAWRAAEKLWMPG